MVRASLGSHVGKPSSGQAVFLRFSPTFDERSARYKWNILERAVKPKSKKKKNQPFPLPILPRPDIPVGGRLVHFVEQWGELTHNKCVLSIVQEGFRIPLKSTPPLSSVLISLSQSSSPLLQEEIAELLQKQAVERVQDPATPGFYSRLFLVSKKNKVTSSNRSFSAKLIHKETNHSRWRQSSQYDNWYWSTTGLSP